MIAVIRKLRWNELGGWNWNGIFEIADLLLERLSAQYIDEIIFAVSWKLKIGKNEEIHMVGLL